MSAVALLVMLAFVAAVAAAVEPFADGRSPKTLLLVYVPGRTSAPLVSEFRRFARAVRGVVPSREVDAGRATWTGLRREDVLALPGVLLRDDVTGVSVRFAGLPFTCDGLAEWLSLLLPGEATPSACRYAPRSAPA
jgi:hypothetical protein